MTASRHAQGIDPSARSRSRRRALQAVYAWEMGGAGKDRIIEQFRHEQEMQIADLEYFEDLLHGIEKHCDELDAGLAPHLDRDVAQVDPIERAALRLGAYELKYRPDVPVKVIINEAVELAKRFGTADSPAFVNGILDRIAHQLRKGEEEA
jgi:N utilization substance protein B